MQICLDLPGRDSAAYRAFRAETMAERPVCEHCNTAASEVLAHKVQPMWGGGLMDKSNVLALCRGCDRELTRFAPPMRRRKTRSA